MKLQTLYEPYPPEIQEQLDRLHIDHAVAALIDQDQMVVGYTMCHAAGPKDARWHCECDRQT